MTVHLKALWKILNKGLRRQNETNLCSTFDMPLKKVVIISAAKLKFQANYL